MTFRTQPQCGSDKRWRKKLAVFHLPMKQRETTTCFIGR